MAIFSLPFLLLLVFTTAQLLFGEGQAADLQGLEGQESLQKHSSIGRNVQQFEPIYGHPLNRDKANHNHYKPENGIASPKTAQFGSLFLKEKEIAAVGSEICTDEYNIFKTIDCCQVKTIFPKASSGVFTIGGPSMPSGSPGYTFSFRCDMETDGGDWMLIQRRVPGGAVNFTRNWEDYETGFGNLNEEFWYGLRNLHCLTTQREMELRIDMVPKYTNTKMSWTYQTFRVAGAGDKYRLTIGGGQGEGRDAMAYHNDQQFSTYDEDNDRFADGSCAYRYQGGWWYKSCQQANLNGPHNIPLLPELNDALAKIVWFDIHTLELWSVEMKIRDKECHM